MTFGCNKCGVCCRMLRQNDLYKEYDCGDGVCKYLDGNLCSIYERRPDICNVDRMYDLHYSEICSRTEYYRLNEMACRRLRNIKISILSEK